VKFKSAIISQNYRVSISHCEPNSIKTDAPMSVVWDILRCWHKLHPAKLEKQQPNSVCVKILSKEPSITADFTEREDAVSKVTVPRFFKIPGGGPKPRASGKKRKIKSIGPNEKKRRKLNPKQDNQL